MEQEKLPINNAIIANGVGYDPSEINAPDRKSTRLNSSHRH